MGSTELTGREQNTLDTLRDWISRHGYPPSVRQLAAELGIGHAQAGRLLSSLKAKGAIQTVPHLARAITLIDD